MVKKPASLRTYLVAGIALSSLWLLWSKNGGFKLWGSGNSSDGIPVLVASRFIPPFQIIRDADFHLQMFPREFVPPGSLHAGAELLNDENRPQYSSIVGIPEGQPLTRTVLAEVGKDHGMSSLLRPGKVAVSFRVDNSKSAGGWVKPGDSIAIFQRMSMSPLSQAATAKTRLLLSNVEVLAVDQDHLGFDKTIAKSAKEKEEDRLLAGANDGHVLTVLVNTADAAAIVEAQETGSLTVVLRSLGDDFPWLPDLSRKADRHP